MSRMRHKPNALPSSVGTGLSCQSSIGRPVSLGRVIPNICAGPEDQRPVARSKRAGLCRIPRSRSRSARRRRKLVKTSPLVSEIRQTLAILIQPAFRPAPAGRVRHVGHQQVAIGQRRNVLDSVLVLASSRRGPPPRSLQATRPRLRCAASQQRPRPATSDRSRRPGRPMPVMSGQARRRGYARRADRSSVCPRIRPRGARRRRAERDAVRFARPGLDCDGGTNRACAIWARRAAPCRHRTRWQVAVRREVGAVDLPAIVLVARHLVPAALPGVDAQPDRRSTRRRGGCRPARMRETPQCRQPLDPLHQRPGRAVEQIDLLLRGQHRSSGSIRRRRSARRPGSSRRLDLADIARSGGQPDRPLELAVGERPDSHRLVVRTGHRPASVAIGRSAPDWSRVHPRIDHQHRPVIELRRILPDLRRRAPVHSDRIRARDDTERTPAMTLPPIGSGSSCASARRRPACAAKSP